MDTSTIDAQGMLPSSSPLDSTLSRKQKRKAAIVAEFQCPVCHDILQAASETSCGHCFCAPCLTRTLRISKACPLCRKSIKNVHPSFVLRNVIQKSGVKPAAPSIKSIRDLDRELQAVFPAPVELNTSAQRFRPSDLGFCVIAVAVVALLVFVFPATKKPKTEPIVKSKEGAPSPSPTPSPSPSSTKGKPPLIKPKPKVSREETGTEKLIAAALAGDAQLVQSLLDSGAAKVTDVLDDSSLYTALHMAAAEGMVDTVKLLLERGSEIDRPAREFRTPLHEAAAAGQLRVVNILIRAGAKVDASTSFGATPLWLAVQKSHRDVAEALLLTKAVDVNVQDMAQYYSPLHLVATTGDIDLAHLLLRQPNISVNLRAKMGWTPLYVAARAGHRVICKMLLDKGANIEAKSDENATPLYVATEYGQTEVVRLLIEKGANIEIPMASGATPLVIASQKGQRDMVRVLIDGGARLSVSGAERMNSLHLATLGKFQEIIRILLDAGIDPDAQDTNGNTALHHAVYQNMVGTVSMLLRYGADFNLRNSKGASSLELFRYMYETDGVFAGAERVTVKIVPTAAEDKGATDLKQVSTLLQVNSVVTIRELMVIVQRVYDLKIVSLRDESDREYSSSSSSMTETSELNDSSSVLVTELPRQSQLPPTLRVVLSKRTILK